MSLTECPSMMSAFCTGNSKVMDAQGHHDHVQLIMVHQITSSSTKLKIQNGLEKARSTHLTLYGVGPMQFNGSPNKVERLYLAAVQMSRWRSRLALSLTSVTTKYGGDPTRNSDSRPLHPLLDAVIALSDHDRRGVHRRHILDGLEGL